MTIMGDLRALARLRERGALTEEEFQAAKAALLEQVPDAVELDLRTGREPPRPLDRRERWAVGASGAVLVLATVLLAAGRMQWLATLAIAVISALIVLLHRSEETE